MSVHPTAIVAPGAELHPTVEVGPYAVIGARVRLGAGTTVGPHAVLDGDTTIGARNRIFHHASVGATPQDLKYAGEKTKLVIGDDNQVREFASIHIGTEGGGGVTRIGDKNLFMANSHVAHDCVVGNGCVLANSVALAGHVELGDHVIMGGLSAVHQFTRIGKHAFIGAASMVVMDVVPYCTTHGDRAELIGVNATGLDRHGFTAEQIGRIKDAYKTIFRSKLVLADALAQVERELGQHPEVRVMLDFISQSKRGLTR